MNHGDAGAGYGGSGVATILLLTAALLAYVLPAVDRRAEPRGWSGWRTASFALGVVLVGVALQPGLLPTDDFRGHMAQHLVIGMVAPLLLVLGAPVTLLLRSVTPRVGRFVGELLRSRPAHLIASPVTALVLNLGGLAAIYGTPLYAEMLRNGAVHTLVTVHVFLAGYLFAWVVAGPDPAPRRPSVPVRLVVLGIAVAGHAVLSQLLYAGVLDVPVPADQRRGAAELMYYGGDIAELLVAVALVSRWRPRRRARTGTAGAGG
ncbi:cytochrome c oxidase assembly protein [Nakamurella deserti]|uniref:cytochrome c oxidase assembly protein n=1 Tax=Nakamurella deserti TaxID=2164074 RepID=UPI000DBE3B3E|nr:cytochrome c oxidase assembly protein [Nakamurella deserti]